MALNRKFAFVAVFILLCLLVTVPAFAGTTYEITVTCEYNSIAVAGYELSAYKVIDIDPLSSTPYVVANRWKGLFEEVPKTTEEWDAILSKSKTYIEKNSVLPEYIVKTNSFGKVTLKIPEDRAGVYLFLGEKDKNGYCVLPFLGTAPQFDSDGKVVKTMSVTPKFVYEAPATPSPTPVVTQTPPPDEQLPQTGTVWWPVMIVSVIGVVLCVLGIALRKQRRV